MSDELRTDFSTLQDRAASAHPAFAAFREEMRHRCYGAEALNSAWGWFRMGWTEADTSARADTIVTAAHRASSLVDDAVLRAKLKKELADVGYALFADCGDRPGHISRILRIVSDHLGRGQR